jgi:hypothetical protein
MTLEYSCEQCQDSLPWYVAYSLPKDERAAMERHLASCERCFGALAECREVATALRRADDTIPAASSATWARISCRVREQMGRTDSINERSTGRLHERSVTSTRTPTDLLSTTALRRGHAIVGLVAVVALIALSVGVFSNFATRGASRRSTIAATPQPACAPSQATANLPAHITLTAIAPLGTDDGWAVGTATDPQHQESPPSAVMLRLRNCHWAPEGAPIPHAQLSDISMVTVNEGWAVGATMTLDTTPLSNGQPANVWEASRPLVLHYTGGSWQTAQVSAGPKTSAEQVKMVSATEGWMLLYDGKRLTTVNGVYGLWYGLSLQHYLNGTWTNVPLDFLKPLMTVTDLDARGPGDVWLVGFNNNSPESRRSYALAAHYTGGAWTTYTGATISVDAVGFVSVSALSPTDVWAGGNGLYHFDGARWTQASINPSSFPLSLEQIVMLSPTQGWAIPAPMNVLFNKAAEENVLRYDHGVWQWTTLSLHGALTPLPRLTRFAPSSPTQGWAIAFQVVNGYPHYALLYDDAGAWGVVRQQS